MLARILIITRILMDDVNPEGGGEAPRENPIDDALGGTIHHSS